MLKKPTQSRLISHDYPVRTLQFRLDGRGPHNRMVKPAAECGGPLYHRHRDREALHMNSAANTPFELFFDQLRDLYSAEVQLYEAMPNLVAFCSNEDLGYLLVNHACQNCDQIAEIVAIFDRHGESPENGQCKAMAGLIEGGTAHLQGVRSSQTRDLMMIGHCLRIEYYEMAAYEITTLLSTRLGLRREPDILSGLLAEEKDMAATLMQLEPDLFEQANHSGK